jgi:sarcosine oxidase, subunit beta
MSQSCDFAVIGGGIVGASIAWQLAKRRAGRVLLFERDVIAAGASGRTGALLRRHYSNEPEAMLAQVSHKVFCDWPHTVGGSCGFEPAGIVVTVDMSDDNASNLDRMRQNIAMQNRLGIESRLISPAELKALQPFVEVSDLKGAAYEPSSGYVDAIAATRSLTQAAMRVGAEVVESSPVRGLAIEQNRVTGIITDSAQVNAGAVICAAGPWTNTIMASAGIELPISALRVQIAIVQRPLELQDPHFVFIDTAAGMFTRPWGPGRSLIGLGGGDQHDPVNPEDFEVRNDPYYPRAAIAAAGKRIPAMNRAVYLHGHAGLYDMTPDAHPILGATSIDGLFVAAGFSGAGFKKGPAVGIGLAELLLEGQTRTVDLAPFSLERFDDPNWNRPWSETEYTFSSDFGHKL